MIKARNFQACVVRRRSKHQPRMPSLAALTVCLAMLAPCALQAKDVEALVKVCAACHGEAGVSELENIPSLAGQPEFFLFDQLFYMRERVRPVPEMEAIVALLSDAELTALSRYYAKATPNKAGPPPDPALVRRAEALASARRCTSCHGPALHGREAIPRLAGQRADYLLKALKSYRDGTRRSADTTMTAAVRGLSDDDLASLAQYASSK